LNIAFIGGGNMARSLIGGLLARGWRAEQIAVADPMPARRSPGETRISQSTAALSLAPAAPPDAGGQALTLPCSQAETCEHVRGLDGRIVRTVAAAPRAAG